MTSSARSWLSVALFVPLAAILLAAFACLPAPVGEAGKSKVDPAIGGVYRLVPPDANDKTTQLAILRPWDEHVYLLEYVQTGEKDGKEVRQMQHFKAWLTSLGGGTFLTAEPLDDLRFAFGDDGSKPFWVVLRLDVTATGMDVRMVNPESEYIKGMTKREEFEAAIKAHAGDQPLFTQLLTFKKLAKDDRAQVDEVLAKFDTARTAK